MGTDTTNGDKPEPSQLVVRTMYFELLGHNLRNFHSVSTRTMIELTQMNHRSQSSGNRRPRRAYRGAAMHTSRVSDG